MNLITPTDRKASNAFAFDNFFKFLWWKCYLMVDTFVLYSRWKQILKTIGSAFKQQEYRHRGNIKERNHKTEYEYEFLFPSFFRKFSLVSFTARRNESTVQKRKVPTAALFFAETKHWEDMTPVSFIWRIPARVTLLTQVKHERAEWNYCMTHLYCWWMWWFIGLGSRESEMRNVQWSIRIQNQISAPPKRDWHFMLIRRAIILSKQRKSIEKSLITYSVLPRRMWA